MIQALRRDESGSIAIIFAVMLVPIIGLLGLAIDVGRSYAVANQAQEILDRIAMTSGREYLVNGRNEAKAIDVGRALWEVNKPKGVGTSIDVVSGPTSTGLWTFRWTVSLAIPLRFLPIVGAPTVWTLQRSAGVEFNK